MTSASALPRMPYAFLSPSLLSLPPTQLLRPLETIKVHRLIFIQRMPVSQCPLDNPIFRTDCFPITLLLRLWNLAAALQDLHRHVILRTTKVHNAIPRRICLFARWTDDPMYVTPQQTICENSHRIAEVHYGVSGEGLHVAPFRAFTGWEDLKSTESVEEKCYTAEVGVFSQSKLAVVHGLRRCFDETDLVARAAGETMEVGESMRWELEVSV